MTPWAEVRAWVLLLFLSVPACVVLLHPVWIELARARARRRSRDGGEPIASVSLVVPLARTEPFARANVLSYLAQRGLAACQVIVVTESASDPAAREIRGLAATDSGTEMQQVSSGDPQGRIAKIHNLRRAIPLCRHGVLVFIDGDVRLRDPLALRRFVQPTARTATGLVTAAPLYRSPHTLGGLLLAGMINADLWAYFALLDLGGRLNVANGAMLAMRRQVLDQIGAFADLEHQLLNDTALARKVRDCGLEIALAPEPAPIPTPPLSVRDWWRQVMRWHVGMRAVLPLSEYLLYGWHRSPVLLGLIGVLAFPAWPHRWWFVLVPVGARLLSGLALHLRWLREPRSAMEIPLTVLTDLLSPGVWLASWWTGTVEWRGRTYHVGRKGVAEEVAGA